MPTTIAKVDVAAIDRDLRARFFDVAKRADSPKSTAAERAELRKMFDEAPALWQAIGDLSALALNRLLDVAIKAEYSQRHAYDRALMQMRADLGWDSSSAAERLLIEQVLLCYIRQQIAEFTFTNVMHESGGISLTKAEHHERVLTMTQARYLRSIEALARVRRLLSRPQVNINMPGGQQVNVAGNVTPGATMAKWY